MIISHKILYYLQHSIVHKFGKDIKSVNDCAELAGEISKNGPLLNAQTFRRFFGLVKSSGGFSKYTLDTLARYCGSADYKTFVEGLAKNDLASILQELGSDNSPSDYWKISDKLCEKISESPAALASVHHELLKYPRARTYFIEHHPMRDLAGTVYTLYFHRYLKYENHNEAKLFAYGFLYMGSYLTENAEFMEIYHQKISETELTPDVYVLPAGRKFGVMLLHAWVQQDEKSFKKIYKEMLLAREQYRTVSERSVCSFEYSVLEHLIYTDKTEEMRFLIENNTKQKFSDRKFVPQDRKENHDECWKIMCAVAYYKMGEYEKSESLLRKTNLDHLALGWKKSYSILYYFMKYEFSGSEERVEIKAILARLIEETHFVYYLKRLNSLDNNYALNLAPVTW
ncbi:hypothetical protein [Kaistella palustris]|uniref:hypothetical protein n=1 Tax=Kaistella palustris TaxID=493376 RepID=UPI0003F5DFA8|nr:hypothetical protein [Kaistella palustris]